MDITILDPKTGIPVKEEKTEPVTPPNVEGGQDMLYQQIGELFDLKPSEISLHKDRIDTLIQYAKTQTEDTSSTGIKWAIRNLSFKVGTPPLGEKLINYLGKYAWVKLEQAKLDKEVNQYERSGSI